MKMTYIKVHNLQQQKNFNCVCDIKAIIETSSSIQQPPLQKPHDPPLSACETPRARWLHQLKAARDAMIRKLFEIPAESERRAHAERLAKAQRVFWRWLKKGKK